MPDLHTKYVQDALLLAQKRRGFCAPNPAVGVVVIKENQVIATGYHQSAGGPHAEVRAFEKLSLEASAGSTVYLTLEPCCHYGKTPPCTQLLIQRKVKAVYYGFMDPNPAVCGQGKKQLEAAGISCIHLPCPEIDAFYRSYAYWTDTKLPWVTAKLAMSLDGKIAGKGGERVIISGAVSHRFTHACRKQSDAILTTVKTVLKDNPQLNVRIAGEVIQKKPLYVLDKQLDFPTDAQLLQTAQHITLFHHPDADIKRKAFWESQGVRCVAIPKFSHHKQIDPVAVLTYIGKAGIHDLFLEAGGICFESWVREKHIQRALICVSPKWLGPDAQSAFPDSTSIFNHMPGLTWHALGEDRLLEFFPALE
jgi:diaminohydroxyphosphoribosylaminopyrimidine deaminase/5-amino-6-(5-phosphoribosylamino)uracil reductase